METKEKQVKGGEKPKEKIFIDNSLNEDSKKEVDLDMANYRCKRTKSGKCRRRPTSSRRIRR